MDGIAYGDHKHNASLVNDGGTATVQYAFKLDPSLFGHKMTLKPVSEYTVREA